MSAPLVGGDPCGVDTLSRTLGGHSTTTQAQASRFGRALSTLPPARFQGGKAEASRSFVTQLQQASATAADAYDRVGSFLPRVSRSIDEAQQAEKRLDRAKAAVTRAQAEVGAAEIAVLTATAAVEAARVRAGAGALLGLPTPGPSAASVAALDAARRRLTRAQHHLDDAQDDRRRAQQHFDDAQRHRIDVLNAFSRLCSAEASRLDRAVPQAPPPATGFENFLSYLMGNNPQGDVLHHEASALRELPTIAAFAELHPKDLAIVRIALRAQDPLLIDEITPHFQPLRSTPPIKPSEHRSTLEKIGHRIDVVTGAIKDGGVTVADGAKDSVVGLGTDLRDLGQQTLRRYGFYGTAAMFDQQQQDQQAQTALFRDPLGTVKNAVGYDDFKNHPLHAIGGLIPGVASAYLTDGASTELRALRAQDAAARSTARFHEARSAATGDRSAAQIAAQARQRSRDLEPSLRRLQRTNSALKGYGTTGEITGLNSFLQANGQDVYGCRPYTGGGLVAGKLSGKAVPPLRRRLHP